MKQLAIALVAIAIVLVLPSRARAAPPEVLALNADLSLTHPACTDRLSALEPLPPTCTGTDGSPHEVAGAAVDAKSPLSFETSIAAPDYTFPLWSGDGTLIWQRLTEGADVTCRVMPEGKQKPQAAGAPAESLPCSFDNGARPHLDIPGTQPQVGIVELSFKKGGADRILRFHLSVCAFGLAPFILPGASSSQLDIASPSDACAPHLASAVALRFGAADAGATVVPLLDSQATAAADASMRRSKRFLVRDVPRTLATVVGADQDSTQVLATLVDSQDRALGLVRATVARPIKSAALSISYYPPHFKSYSGAAPTDAKALLGHAIRDSSGTTGCGAAGQSEGVVNQAQLSIPAMLGDWSVAIDSSMGCLAGSTKVGNGNALVTFRATLTASTPPMATLTTYSADLSAPKTVVSVALSDDVVDMSLPLPIHDRLGIQCNDNEVADHKIDGSGSNEISRGKTIAIRDGDLAEGHCSVYVQCDTNPTQQALFGKQVLAVRIEREGMQKIEVDPVGIDVPQRCLGHGNELAYLFSLPSFEAKGSGLYTVTVEEHVEEAGIVRYFGVKTSEAGADIRSELVFRAQLRPKGPFGWPTHLGKSIRAYFTAALTATALRFPADSSKLKDSEATPAVEFLPPSVGLLFTIEPWDYDRGENIIPLGLMFQSGFKFVSLGGAEVFDVSVLTGLAARAPLVTDGSSQLGTSLSAGLFWEHQLSGTEPDHFLVTLGLNIGTLFSGAEKK